MSFEWLAGKTGKVDMMIVDDLAKTNITHQNYMLSTLRLGS